MEFFVGSALFKRKLEGGAGLSREPSIYFGVNFAIGTTAPWKVLASRNVFFSGARLTETSFLSHWNFGSASHDNVLAHYESRHSDFSLGVFALLSWTELEWELCLDRLAQYTVFVWRRGDEYLLSNSMDMLLNLLLLAGVEVKRSPRNVVEGLSYGTTFGGATGFEDVWLYRTPRAFIEDGKLIESHDQFLSELYTVSSGNCYERLLEETVNFARNAAKNICAEALKSQALVDVTGGVDSRIVLSLFLNASLKTEEIHAFCVGGDARADKIVADYLVEKYKLSPGELFVAKSPHPGRATRSLEVDSARFYGMKLSDFGDFGDGHVVGQTKVTGYYGELGRLFYDKDPTGNSELAEEIVSEGNVRRFVASEVVNGLREKVVSFLERLDRLGLSFDNKLHALYLLNRNKVHFGISAHLADRTRQAFHPLNSALLVKLSLLVSREERKANKVGFDLISGLCPALVAEPMAGKVWSRILFKSDFNYSQYRSSALVKNGAPALSSKRYKYPQRNLLHRKVARTTENRAFSDRMRRLGIQYHWALLPDLRARVLEILSTVEGEFGQNNDLALLNIEGIRQMLSAINLQAEVHTDVGIGNADAKFLLKLLPALVWIAAHSCYPTVPFRFELNVSRDSE